MTIDEVRVGQRVRTSDGLDEGVVERVDRDDYIVWFRVPIPGHPGETDLVDIDPGDLVAA